MGEGDDNYINHQVTLSDYFIGETEVTQELWVAVMGSNPSYFRNDLQCPVEMVSWYMCQDFISRLNRITGKSFRLPTEAEWEYAAQGGILSKGFQYSGSNIIDDVAWFAKNSITRTHPVSTKAPNELGLYDMTGNVNERCNDWFGSYSEISQTNPQGPTIGDYKVSRGGSWNQYEGACKVWTRYKEEPSFTYYNLGLRLAL